MWDRTWSVPVVTGNATAGPKGTCRAGCLNRGTGEGPGTRAGIERTRGSGRRGAYVPWTPRHRLGHGPGERRAPVSASPAVSGTRSPGRGCECKGTRPRLGTWQKQDAPKGGAGRTRRFWSLGPGPFVALSVCDWLQGTDTVLRT